MMCSNPLCGIEFIPTKMNQKYCESSCMLRAKSRRFRESNPAAVRRSYTRWRKDNKETALENRRKWYRENREKSLEYARVYSKLDWDKTKISLKRSRAKRRARLKGHKPESTITLIEWTALLKAYKNCCAYCKMPDDNLTQDHVIPLSKGGDSTMDNLVPACRSCNCSKGDKDVDEFMYWLRQRKGWVL